MKPRLVTLSEAKNLGTSCPRVSIQTEALRFAQGDKKKR
jgi:hypothetical protein